MRDSSPLLSFLFSLGTIYPLTIVITGIVLPYRSEICQITIRAIDEKNNRTGCRGSLAREGGSLESYWRFAPREFKSPPRRLYMSLQIIFMSS